MSVFHPANRVTVAVQATAAPSHPCSRHVAPPNKLVLVIVADGVRSVATSSPQLVSACGCATRQTLPDLYRHIGKLPGEESL